MEVKAKKNKLKEKKAKIQEEISQEIEELDDGNNKAELELNEGNEVNEDNEEDDNNDTQIELPENKTVFISGIPYEANEDDLRGIFAECGEIQEIKLPKYQDSGKNRGYAHIQFKKNKGVKKALRKNNVTLKNRYLTVEVSKGEAVKERKVDFTDIPDGCKTIMIKNLPYDTKEEDLGHKFKPCGKIRSIRLVYHSSLGHFKGFAFIDFETTEAVKIALHLNGKDFNGRKMTVDYEENKPKKGYKFRGKSHSKFNKDYNTVVQKTLKKKRTRNQEN